MKIPNNKNITATAVAVAVAVDVDALSSATVSVRQRGQQLQERERGKALKLNMVCNQNSALKINKRRRKWRGRTLARDAKGVIELHTNKIHTVIQETVLTKW